MIRAFRVAVAVLAVPALGATVTAQEIAYRVTIPQPEHRWLQVEATFTGAAPPLELRMSRSSPGRYALHEFAKNVYDVRAFDARGSELALTRPDPYGWTIASFSGPVRLAYKVFGDRVDGTYLAVDTTHAHMNMPATFMWARGMADRPIRVTFVPPPGVTWVAATQLFPTADPWMFTAPNLQYFMDSPTELGPVWEYRFTTPQPDGSGQASFRIALHHLAGDAAAQQYAAGVERIAAEAGAIFGEFPAYEPGYYTVLADYLPYADGDGMEHRNSTVVSGRSDLADATRRRGALSTVAHELFHGWNVERIRPATLEPFDFERANMSDALWLAEGFTSYYGELLLARAGLSDIGETLGAVGTTIDGVVNSTARQFRSVVDMSRMAPFVDAARPVDETNFEIAFLSYYTWGAAIAIGLDLSLRDFTGGRVTLDDYMRALWRAHGRAPGPAPGVVAKPYTLEDARDRLAEVSGSRRFAEEFFTRFVIGRDVVDYARLLGRAGLVLRRRHARQPWAGGLALEPDAAGARIVRLAGPGTPAYVAGLDKDDVIVEIDGRQIGRVEDVEAAIAARRPGSTIAVRVLRRGTPASASVTLVDDPSLELVTLESTGGTPTEEQMQFRRAWLGSRVAR